MTMGDLAHFLAVSASMVRPSQTTCPSMMLNYLFVRTKTYLKIRVLHGLRHRFAWVDQHVVGRKTVERECEIHRLPGAAAKQRMPEAEAAGGDLPWQRLVQAQCEQCKLVSA